MRTHSKTLLTSWTNWPGQLGVSKYSMYVMDYGAPVGYRLALRHPERVQALIVQNGNAYDEGLLKFWDPIKAYWNEQCSREAGRDSFSR